MKSVLVTGGTGHLGKHVVDLSLKKKFATRILSTKLENPFNQNVLVNKGNLANNIGLKEAIEEAEIIIHCASNSRNFEAVDINGTQNLLKAINKNETKHFVYISIVGVDKSDFPYYKAKYAAERIVANSGIPHTILRATQFHGFVLNILKSFVNESNGSIIKIPSGMKFQPVSAAEVAEQLVNCVEKPAGLLPDFGGPEVLSFDQMAQQFLYVTETKKKLQAENSKAELYDLFSSGVNLCPANASGKLSWQKFLEEKFKDE